MNLEQTCKYFTWIYRLLDLPIHLVNFMDIKLLLDAITSQSIFFVIYTFQGENSVFNFFSIYTRDKLSFHIFQNLYKGKN